MFFRRRTMDLTDRRTWKRRPWSHPAALLVPIAFALLPVLTPFTNPGFPLGHDAGAHLTYVYRLDHALSEPEFAAITFGVGVLWALDRVLTTRSRAMVPVLAVLTGLLLMCHLPATLIMAPMLSAFALQLWLSGQVAPTAPRRALLGLTLGVGLASFYVWPALLEWHLIQGSRLTTGRAAFDQHFVPVAQFLRFGFGYAWKFGNSVQNANDLMPLHVAGVEWALMACGGCLLLRQLGRGVLDERGAAVGAWLGSIAFALFMMTRASESVWRIITPLAYIQFPWRFFLLISIAAAAMAAPLLSLLTPRAQALVLITIVALQTNLYHRQLKPSGYSPAEQVNIDNPAWRETPEGQDWGFIDPAFDPMGVTAHPPNIVGRWRIASGAGTAHPRALTDDRIVLDVATTRGVTVTIHTYYFPGWSVRLDEMPIAVHGRPGDHYMDVSVPPGEHRLEAEFGNTAVRTWSNVISLISVLLVGLAARPALRLDRLGGGLLKTASESSTPQR